MLAVQSLVYALGGMCLVVVATTWLLMHFSANFAHARRDMRVLVQGQEHSSHDHDVSGAAKPSLVIR